MPGLLFLNRNSAAYAFWRGIHFLVAESIRILLLPYWRMGYVPYAEGHFITCDVLLK